MRRGVPRRLHLRGQADALHPPRRVRRLRCLRAGLPGRGDLLRGRHPGAVEGLLQGQRRLLRRPRLARRRRQARQDRQGPPARRGAAAAGARRTDRGGAASRPARPSRRRLPDFPWDQLDAVRRAARARTRTASSTCRSARPVDPTPAVGPGGARAPPPTPRATRRRRARRRCAQAAVDWLARRCGVDRRSTSTACCRRSAPRSWSPGCRRCSGSAPATSSCIPALAYPTYEVGARARRRRRRGRPTR